MVKLVWTDLSSTAIETEMIKFNKHHISGGEFY